MLNKKGFSIISILVAMSIFMIVMLGLLSGIMLSMHLTTRNLLRNEAVRIVQEQFDHYRNVSNTDINHDFTATTTTCSDCLDNSSPSVCHIVNRHINNYDATFAMLFSGSSVSVAGRFINRDNISICWKYKNTLYEKHFETVILK